MAVIDPKVEIEFTAGVWTDVTADVDLTAGITTNYGRTSEFSTPSVATCDFQLANHLGKYTPFSQMLADGVTVHPYYPNVVPRKRVRVTHTGGSDFFGYIKAWPPTLENGTRAYVPVSATDRQDQEAKFTAQPAHIASILADAPFALWTNTEPAGVTTSYDLASGLPLTLIPGVGATFGVANLAPVAEGTTALGVKFNTFGTVDNLKWRTYLTRAILPAATATTWSLEFWGSVDATAANSLNQVRIQIGNTAQTAQISITDAKDGVSGSGTAFYVNGANNITMPFTSTTLDRAAHHYAMTAQDTGASLLLKFYLDGTLTASATGVTGDGGLTSNDWIMGGGAPDIDTVTAAYGPIAVHATTLSGARIFSHALIGRGTPSLSPANRAKEYYFWQGVPLGEMSLDPGVATVVSHPTGGKSLLTLLSEMATTEGGGSVAYHLPSGAARFCDRNFRKPGSPLATLDVTKDIIGQPFAPSVDDLTLITTSTVTRNGAGEFTYTDAASQAAYGLTGDTATTFADNDQDAANLAQSRVVGNSKPRLRLPQFAVDLFTAETAGLATAFGSLQIGSRLRLTALPVGVASSSQFDVIVEGWSLNITKSQWLYTIDASPADNPRRAVWDSFRWGCDSMTLTSTVTAAALSISVTTAAGKPTFSTSAGVYPLAIKIGEEEMTITAAPASSTSPQTLTVTRGTSGTKAAPQTAGAAVTLSPASAWTL